MLPKWIEQLQCWGNNSSDVPIGNGLVKENIGTKEDITLCSLQTDDIVICVMFDVIEKAGPGDRRAARGRGGQNQVDERLRHADQH